jgi:hypothetical protein
MGFDLLTPSWFDKGNQVKNGGKFPKPQTLGTGI